MPVSWHTSVRSLSATLMFSRMVNRTSAAVLLPEFRWAWRPSPSPSRTSWGISLSALRYRFRAASSTESYIDGFILLILLGVSSCLRVSVVFVAPREFRRLETHELNRSNRKPYLTLIRSDNDVSPPGRVRRGIVRSIVRSPRLLPHQRASSDHFGNQSHVNHVDRLIPLRIIDR